MNNRRKNKFGNEIKLERLLIVEDDVAENIRAQMYAYKAGYENVATATTLSQALHDFPNADYVMTDLFYPAGDAELAAEKSKELLPLYQAYKEKTFPPIGDNDIVLQAIESVASLFGVTPEEYVRDIMTQLSPPQSSVLKAAYDAVQGYSDTRKREKFECIELDVQNAINMPLGIYIAKLAKTQSKPAVIVTNTNHHDLAFNPISGQIPIPYTDAITDDGKAWEKGFDLLAHQIKMYDTKHVGDK